MIGVVSKASQRKVVEEFFQLFKTPWEFYREGAAYDVLLAAGPEVPAAAASLMIIYGAEPRAVDKEFSRVRCKRRNVPLMFRGSKIPLYHDVLSFEHRGKNIVCTGGTSEITGLQFERDGSNVIRLGFDLFAEIETLLTEGQPLENATSPTIELHIQMLRQLIVEAGITVLELCPSPFGYDFAVCLTHDIDFVGIRRHRLDHTMWGFLYRSTLGSLFGFVRGKRSFGRLLQSWKAALALPLVYLGWVKDFWLLFDWYLQVEKGLSPTYFFIPFKGRRGEKVVARHPGRRATAYDIGDIPELASQLMREGCELGVHGLDAWHDVQKAREERQRLAAVTGPVEVGIRTHWLLQDADTYRVLDEAGYDYDSTAGYNETPGYRCGTGQVFRPLTASNLLELPLHIQDGALFYSKRLDLSESEALELCHGFIQNAQRFGGVLTLLWHDRSPGPERFWGEFYARLVSELKTFGPWFATGSQVVAWFRQRRAVAFERLESAEGIIGTKLRGNGRRISPPLKIRIHSPLQAGLDQPAFTELAWEGDTEIEFGSERATPNYPAMGVLAISTCE